jgi:outer membrane protein assembly factor BamB
MKTTRREFVCRVILWLCLCAAWPAAALAQTASDIKIEWKNTWDETYSANLARWQAELPQNTPQNVQLLRGRTVALVDALIQKYPQDLKRRSQGRLQQADDYGFLNKPDLAFDVLKKTIDENAGDFGLAVAAMGKMVGIAQYHATDHYADIIRYACAGLTALNKAGVLPDDDQIYLNVLLAAFYMEQAKGNNFEAIEYAAALNAGKCADPTFVSREMEVWAYLGRTDLAQSYAEAVFAQTGDEGYRQRAKFYASLAAARPNFYHKAAVDNRRDVILARGSEGQTLAIQGIYDDEAAGQVAMPADQPGSSRYTSTWSWLDQLLQSGRPKAIGATASTAPATEDVVAQLRARQEASFAELFSARKSPADKPPDALAAFRKYPWSQAANRALLHAGQAALQKGHCGLAIKDFQDVLSHSDDQATRQAAQAAYWIALSGQPGPLTLDAATRNLPDGATFPLLGKSLPAKAIMPRLPQAAPISQDQPVPLSALAHNVLKLPAASPWTTDFFEVRPQGMAWFNSTGEIAPAGRDLILAGPKLIACYGDDLSTPRWTHATRGLAGMDHVTYTEPSDRPCEEVPGPFVPAVGGGKVFARVASHAFDMNFDSLAALDQKTGRLLWTTLSRGDPAWDGLWIVSDPAICDGRIYVLACARGYACAMSLHLICADAADGTMLWNKFLATRDASLAFEGNGWRSMDMAHFGNAVTICQGSVYCLSNLGFVCKCDARDGLLDWLYCYPRSMTTNTNSPRLVSRQGCPPVVAGDKIVLMPRDYQGMFALDAQTGKPLWDNALVPTQELVGQVGGTLIVKDIDHLAAVDAATGKKIWMRRFDKGLRATPVLRGGSLCIVHDNELMRVSALAGCDQERCLLAPADTPYHFIIRDNVMIAIGPASQGSQKGRPLNPAAPAPDKNAAAPALPLQESWKLCRPEAQLIVPPPDAAMPDKVLLRSRNLLECISATSQGAVDWQVLLPSPPREIAWGNKAIVLAFIDKVMCIDAATGAVRWTSLSPFSINQCRVFGPYVATSVYFTTDWERAGRYTAVSDLATGKMRWSSEFISQFGPDWTGHFELMGWDGTNLHLLGQQPFGDPKINQVIVTPAGGEPLWQGSYSGQSVVAALALGNGFGFYADSKRQICEFPIARDAKSTPTGSLLPENLRRFAVEGQWLHLSYEPAAYKPSTLILRHGDPAYVFSAAGEGVIRGDRYFQPAGDSLAATDLLTKKTTLYKLPLPAPDCGDAVALVDFWETADKLCIASCDEKEYAGTPRPNTGLRIDCFDRATGALVGSQAMEDIVHYAAIVTTGQWFRRTMNQTQVVAVNGIVLITDLYGLRAYTPAPAAPAKHALSVPLVAHGKIHVDGRLADWAAKPAAQIKTPAGAEARVFLAHDDENFYLALTVPETAFEPLAGDGDMLWGNHLELNIKTGWLYHRAAIGVDSQGRRRPDLQATDDVFKGSQLAVERDVFNRTTTYELSIPLKNLLSPPMIGAKAPVWISIAPWAAGLANEPQFQWRCQLLDLDVMPPAPK